MATIDPKNLLHLMAVPFLGVSDGEGLLVDEATLKACWENRGLLGKTTFTDQVQSNSDSAPEEARDGTNLQTFKVILADFGRDDSFIETAAAALRFADMARRHHDSEDRKGKQTLDEGRLSNQIEADDTLDVDLLDNPIFRDGLRAYANSALQLWLPMTKEDIVRTWEDLGADHTGWEGLREASPSYKDDNPKGSAKDDLARIEAGGTEGELKGQKIQQQTGTPEGQRQGEDTVQPVIIGGVSRFTFSEPHREPPRLRTLEVDLSTTERANAFAERTRRYQRLSAKIRELLLAVAHSRWDSLDGLTEILVALMNKNIEFLAPLVFGEATTAGAETLDELGWESVEDTKHDLLRDDGTFIFTPDDAMAFRGEVARRREELFRANQAAQSPPP